MTHAWLPRASCDDSCVRVDAVGAWGRRVRVLRGTLRTLLVVALLPAIPVLAIPHPAQARLVRVYCRLVLLSMGVRIVSPARNALNIFGE